MAERAALMTAARMAWFAGQYALSVRRAGPVVPPGEAPFKPSVPLPNGQALLKSIWDLAALDRKCVAQGELPPTDFDLPNLGALVQKTRAFLDDSAQVDARRLSKQAADLPDAINRQAYPAYYLRNFHYQTDGYLSDHSAELYDWQVETLFTGTARLMRRQALLPIRRHMAGRDQRGMALADIAVGTGGFLVEAAAAWPRMRRIGVDLSLPYLQHAQTRIAQKTQFAQAQAEALPLADQSVDYATAVFLFHELPDRARDQVIRELARITKPGGMIVIVDALQTGDQPAFDGLLELFPRGFHEPFFDSWTRYDLKSAMSAFGFHLIEHRLAHLAKVAAFVRSGL
jgi:ubiquinone/menaquinone biosynthesis C-methylase UbiE